MDVYYNNELLNSKESCALKYDSYVGFNIIECSNGLAIIVGYFNVNTNGNVGTYEKDITYPFQFDGIPALSLSVLDHDCTVYAVSQGIWGFGISLNLKKRSSSASVIVDYFTIGKRA